MPDFEADPGFISQDQGTIYDYEASVGEVAGASFGRQMDTNLFQFVLRETDFLSEDLKSLTGESERVDQKSAQEEVRKRGLDLKIPVGGITRQELDTLQYLKQREIQQNLTMARRSGVGATVATFGAGLAAGATDPLNVASAFIPVVGEARYAAWLAKSNSFAGRAAIRAGVGATEGAVGAAVIEPIVYAGAQAEQFDYTGADSFLNVMFGTVLGGGLHVAGGAYADWRQMPVSQAVAREAATNASESVQLEAIQNAVDALESELPVRSEEIIRAYHGSPHTFERFDISKIGEGEGHQAFGHGLYFAQSPAVAADYRSKLAATLESEAGFIARNSMEAAKGDRARAAADLRRDIGEMAQDDAKRADMEEAVQLLENDVPLEPPGSLYEVGIKARVDELFDWDKPVGEQSKAAQAVVRQFFPGATDKILAETRGDAVVSLLKRQKKSQDLTAALKAAGFKGIQYLDQRSRDAGEGTRNFVIFDDADVDIVSRNGQSVGQSKGQLGGLIEKAKQERTADTFNRQFVDDPAAVEASRQGDEVVAKAKSEDLETVAADTEFLDQQIKGLKTREMWTAADDKALEAGEARAAELEQVASIYRAAAVCMAE